MEHFTRERKKVTYYPKKTRFLVNERCLSEDNEKSDNISSINSDHSAIILHFSSIGKRKHSPSFWKFNASLVDDTKYAALLTRKCTSVAS